STDADVLSIRVHLARMREQTIRNDAALKTAQAALNDVLGEPIDTPYTLTSAPTPLQPIGRRTGELERDAAMKRPEAQRANLAMQVASTQVGLAQSSFWPKLTAHAVFESDRQQFANRGGANWLGSVSLNWNLFNGGADKARLEEARASLLRSRAERDRLSSSLKVEVRRAANDLEAANQQVEVARNTVDEAEESLRITQNRYQVGMSTVTDLLRTEAAVLESRTQYQAALHDQRLAAAMLEFAAGQLSVDSPVVNE
ncbi:MAG TPA: TolC family protein, partial [Bryobacteraceae bacterium]|nr:TolC family protein [Bryobacteraceae bacterium]